MRRAGSPPGASTLITSAPRSPSIWPQRNPRSVLRSSTRHRLNIGLSDSLIELHNYPVGIFEEAGQIFLARRLAVAARVGRGGRDENFYARRLEPLMDRADIIDPPREVRDTHLVEL